MTRTKKRTTTKSNHLIVRLLALLVLIGIGASSGAMLHANAMDENVPPAAVVDNAEAGVVSSQESLLSIEPGDTLLSIAKKYGPEGMSPKQYASLIMERNDLKTAGLQAGQVLRLP